MVAKRRHRRSQGEIEDKAMSSRHGKGPEWWGRYSDQELAKMQRRGQQLREGGWSAVDWS